MRWDEMRWTLVRLNKPGRSTGQLSSAELASAFSLRAPKEEQRWKWLVFVYFLCAKLDCCFVHFVVLLLLYLLLLLSCTPAKYKIFKYPLFFFFTQKLSSAVLSHTLTHTHIHTPTRKHTNSSRQRVELRRTALLLPSLINQLQTNYIISSWLCWLGLVEWMSWVAARSEGCFVVLLLLLVKPYMAFAFLSSARWHSATLNGLSTWLCVYLLCCFCR